MLDLDSATLSNAAVTNPKAVLDSLQNIRQIYASLLFPQNFQADDGSLHQVAY
jgi:hypothetical protein